MKKIILACFATLFMGGVVFAQQAQQPTPEKTKTVKKEVTHASTHAAKAADRQGNSVAAAKKSQAVASATPLKKDGMPDKRYKQHKQHLRKDGTPDKRYKENNP